MQIEQRILNNATGESTISAEDRANPEGLLPPEMPAHFRALALANIRGDKVLAEAAHRSIVAAEEMRSTENALNEEQRELASARLLRELRAF